MDFEVSLYGKCRCCLAEGNHRDVMKEYYRDGNREVYFDMFLECFNVFLSTLCNGSNLICAECIRKLREANDFRMMVISAERMLEAVSQQKNFVAIIENPPECGIKQESLLEVKLEPMEEQEAMEHLDLSEPLETQDNCQGLDVGHNDIGFSDETSEDCRRLEEAEARLLSRFPPEKLRMLPTRDTLYEMCPKYAIQLDILRGKKVWTRDVQALVDSNGEDSKIKEKKRRKFITEKNAHVNNAAAILENSNVAPFKSKSRNGLPCFYCRGVFENINKLRKHQTEHTNVDIRKSLTSHSIDCLVINVDIADLKCGICALEIPNLKELKAHLISAHNKTIFSGFEDRIIPFKIPLDNNFECQMCGVKYETFGSVERHMNTHFRNYVCDECGTGYVTNYRLKMHMKTMHVEGSFQCKACNKVFASHQKHKSHVDTVHNFVKRFKCPKCGERFTDYFKRHQHLVEIHGLPELEYKCNVCDKSYARRYMLSRHMKRDHLEERYFQCDICLNKFFARRDLESHMVKHNGARIFECAVCKKAYARKKTLREHMRIHNNDRRFSCSICGQAFIQNCSLKGHMKTHHPESVGYDK